MAGTSYEKANSFKEGDRIRMRVDCGSSPVAGQEGPLTRVDGVLAFRNFTGDTCTCQSRWELIKNKSTDMSSGKFYRVIKDHPLWDVGAIVKKNEGSEEYQAIDDLFAKEYLEPDSDYTESDTVVEKSGWFERVYPVNLLTKTVYKLKAEAKEMMEKEYAGK